MRLLTTAEKEPYAYAVAALPSTRGEARRTIGGGLGSASLGEAKAESSASLKAESGASLKAESSASLKAESGASLGGALLGEGFELRDEVRREGALGEPPPDLLEDGVPLRLLVRGEVDHRHLVLHPVEGSVVLLADALGEGVRGDLAGVHDDIAQILRE